MKYYESSSSSSSSSSSNSSSKVQFAAMIFKPEQSATIAPHYSSSLSAHGIQLLCASESLPHSTSSSKSRSACELLNSPHRNSFLLSISSSACHRSRTSAAVSIEWDDSLLLLFDGRNSKSSHRYR